MKYLQRCFAGLSCLLILSCYSLSCNAQSKPEILWDNYGVPHVYAGDLPGMYYGFGWSQMHAHGNLLLKLYAQARGTAAAFFGAEMVQSDKLVHAFNLPAVAADNYNRQTKESRLRLDGFVRGINQYAAQHRDKLNPELLDLLPITAADVIAHSTRVICLTFLAGEDLRVLSSSIKPGSNAYAIAPSRSASGNAMLLANPHLPWTDMFLFFEAHLNAPGFNAYGTSLVGQPALNIAFNEHLGWTHTVNTIDASDRYELTLQDGGYLLDGTVVPFEQKTITLQVKQADGSHSAEQIQLLSSRHGPVVATKNEKAYAVRVAGLNNALFFEQYHQMAAAKNLAQFEKAVQMLQNPMFNVIYADKAGNILYVFNGNVPVRPEGDFDFWQQTIDGSKSKYIWNQYHSYQQLPKVLNPASGFVQNANDPPWTSTYPLALKPTDYPAYMAPLFVPLRPQRAINMIKDDPSISFDELIAYKMNTGMESADRFLDDLLAAASASTDTLVQQAIAVLQRWDKQTNNNSRGAVLFSRWLQKVTPTMFKTPWQFDAPISTPDGLANPDQAVTLLSKAAEETRKLYGSLDIAWGDVYRFRGNNGEFPANGGSGRMGIFRVVDYQPMGQKQYAYGGDSYVAVTEFGKKVRAKVVLPYGNASQPGSPHHRDQMQLMSEQGLRDALFYREDVLKHVVRREVLSP